MGRHDRPVWRHHAESGRRPSHVGVLLGSHEHPHDVPAQDRRVPRGDGRGRRRRQRRRRADDGPRPRSRSGQGARVPAGRRGYARSRARSPSWWRSSTSPRVPRSRSRRSRPRTSARPPPPLLGTGDEGQQVEPAKFVDPTGFPRINPVTQFDGGPFQGANCTLASGAMLARLAFGDRDQRVGAPDAPGRPGRRHRARRPRNGAVARLRRQRPQRACCARSSSRTCSRTATGR